MEDDLQNTATRLLQLALEMGALRYGDFTLTSGKKSTYYFDGRLLSLHPEGAYLASQGVASPGAGCRRGSHWRAHAEAPTP